MIIKLEDKKILANAAKKSLLFFFGIVLVFLLEGTAAFFLPDSKLSIAESLSTICQEDPIMLWRQRSGLKIKFYGEDVRTNSIGLRAAELSKKKTEGVKRIICMGASSTFGWGVSQEKSYPVLLEEMLRKNSKSFDIEVLNAGQIGFTTFQGRLFLEKHILDYSPDLVTVSYILNDIDRCRFMRNEKKHDSELTVSLSWKIAFKNIAARSRIYLIGKRALVKAASKNEKFFTYILRRQYENTKIRVSPQQYRDNLTEIAEICKADNIGLVFLKMPVRLMHPQLTQEEKKLMSTGSLLSDFFYKRACFLQARGDYKKAIADFEKARDYQVIECQRDGKRYQEIMEKVAREQGVAMVDVNKLFESEKDIGLLFNGPQDPIHPSVIGHEIIAQAIGRIIEINELIPRVSNKVK